MKSIARLTSTINLPLITGHHSMIPFNLLTLEGLSKEFKNIVGSMLCGIQRDDLTAFFTLHGRKLKKGETLRRGGAHTDGNYEQHLMSFGSGGGGGWKVGENGPEINSKLHARQYLNTKGGIVMASNYRACVGWVGGYKGAPRKGGDCSHIELDDSFALKENSVYYGNNHFIHESLPMSDDIHRVFARITMPETHVYNLN